MRTVACAVLLLCVAEASAGSYGWFGKNNKKDSSDSKDSKKDGCNKFPSWPSASETPEPSSAATVPDTSAPVASSPVVEDTSAPATSAPVVEDTSAPATSAPVTNAPPVIPSGSLCPDHRLVPGCGKCWASEEEASSCTDGTDYKPPFTCTTAAPYMNCGECYATEMEAEQCSCPADAPVLACNACYEEGEGEHCASGCWAKRPFSGCNTCWTTLDAAQSCEEDLEG